MRRATAVLRTLPDFVIIGAQRAGTTSLYDYLVAEPDIRSAQRKEIHFFDGPRGRSVGWYRAHFPLATPRRAGRWLTGEATPYLLFHPSAPQRVAATLPSTRFVVLLRDPVDRAISHWRLAIRLGYDDVSLEEAIAKEPERLAAARTDVANGEVRLSNAFRDYSYVARGEYVDQLERWIAHVDRSRLLVVQSERLFRTPAVVVGEVIEWLGLSSRALATQQFAVHNASEAIAVADDTRARLAAHYEPFNRRLFALLGTSYDWT